MGTTYYYFTISVHVKSGLIREMPFGESSLIRQVAFGESGLIRGELMYLY
jgi:hypothetical protein